MIASHHLCHLGVGVARRAADLRGRLSGGLIRRHRGAGGARYEVGRVVSAGGTRSGVGAVRLVSRVRHRVISFVRPVVALRFEFGVNGSIRSIAMVMMASVDDQGADDQYPGLVPPLTVRVGTTSVRVEAQHAPAVIGRPDPQGGQPVRIPVHDDRVSRVHLVLEVRDGTWYAVPKGRNGTFIDGHPQTEPFALPDDGLRVMLGNQFVGVAVDFSTLDPSKVYVGAQVALRRAELGISQRALAADKIMNAGALIGFEKGRSWPRRSTQHRLEEVLRWPRGHIEELRRQHSAQSAADTAAREEPTMLVGAATGSTTLEVGYMAQTVELALQSIRTNVEGLPAPASREYQRRAAKLLDDLARLEKLASNASRGAVGAESVFQQLSAVRRARRALTVQAAAAPNAALQHRVYAARATADLSAEEAAAMIGLRPDDILAVENGATPAPEDLDRFERLITLLT